MANSDFLGMQLREGEKRAEEAKDRLRLGASMPSEPPQGRQEHDSTPVSDDVVPEEPDSGKTPHRTTGKAQAASGKDWRRVNRRRRTHSLTFSDDEWDEMVEAARRNGTDVSKMLSALWAKKGRKLFG